MQKSEKWFLYITNFIVCATGLAYAWMIYFEKPVNDWDVMNHPWQKHVQGLHVLFAPLLIFAIGWIWKQHIQIRLFRPQEKRKFTGWLLIISLFPMVASGYLLQVSTETWLRSLYSWIHLATSIVWTIFFVIHLIDFTKKSRFKDTKL